MHKIFWCKNCLNMSTRPRIAFDKDGKCNACTWMEEKKKINLNVNEILDKIKEYNFGEIILHSMDRDGTGNGYDLNLVNSLSNLPNKPLLLMGELESLST